MSSTTQREPNLQTAAPPANLQLVNWPLRDDGVSGWIFLAFVMGVAAAIGLITKEAGLALVSFAIMSVAMWRMWIRTTFELGPKGVLQTHWGRRKRRIVWSAVRRCRVQRRGVLLLFDDDPSPLSNAMGLYIRWCDHRDELLAIVRYYIGSRLADDNSE